MIWMMEFNIELIYLHLKKIVMYRDKGGGFNDDEPSYRTNISKYIDSYVIKAHIHVQIVKFGGRKSEKDKN